MATHSAILAWRIPWTEEPGELQSIGSQRVQQGSSDLACVPAHVRTHTHTHHPTHFSSRKPQAKIDDISQS